MADPTDSGIYEIVNLTNGKRYIGSAVNFRARWSQHRTHLRRGTHHSRHLQSSWNKHGQEAFAFLVLCVCSRSQLITLEQTAIDALRPEYNICPLAGSAMGVKHQPRSQRHRENIAMAAKEAWDRRRADGQDQRAPFTDEHRANISKAAADAWSRLKASGYQPKPKSDRHKAALSRSYAARKAAGWKAPARSEKHKAALVVAAAASWADADQRARRTASIKTNWQKRKADGYTHPPLTDEQRARQRAAIQASWERRKANAP